MKNVINIQSRIAGTLALQIAFAAGIANAQMPLYPANNPGFIPFSNDAGTGVSPAKLYTHAVNFENNPPYFVNLNGVLFTNINSSSGTCVGYNGATFGWGGFPQGFYSGAQSIVSPPGEKVRDILTGIRANPELGTIRLEGLI